VAAARRRWVVWLGVPLAALLLALWLAPVLLVQFALPPLAARSGGAIEVTGARPALPFGFAAARLRVVRDGRELVLDELRAVWLPSGPRVDARVAAGTLLVRGDDVFASRGFVRVQGIALESLQPLFGAPLAVRGQADGVWRFGPEASVEGSVSRGAVTVARPAPFELPFAQLVVSAARDPATRDWNVRWVDLQGPPLSGNATGRIGADGALALTAQVRQLEEPVRSFFALAQLPTDPLPLALSLEGTLAAPRLSATAPAAGR